MTSRPSLSLADAADYFGVHPNTVRRWALAGHLPYIRLGGRWRFAQADLDAYLQRRSHEATETE